eukprot:6890466-Pyramimonas_sp.AAC.3
MISGVPWLGDSAPLLGALIPWPSRAAIGRTIVLGHLDSAGIPWLSAWTPWLSARAPLAQCHGPFFTFGRCLMWHAGSELGHPGSVLVCPATNALHPYYPAVEIGTRILTLHWIGGCFEGMTGEVDTLSKALKAWTTP